MLLSLADSQFARSFFPRGTRGLRRNFWGSKMERLTFHDQKVEIHHISCQVLAFRKGDVTHHPVFFTNNKNNKTPMIMSTVLFRYQHI